MHKNFLPVYSAKNIKNVRNFQSYITNILPPFLTVHIICKGTSSKPETISNHKDCDIQTTSVFISSALLH